MRNQTTLKGPLEGITVLEHTTALAGPYCAQLLGDLGADVIKIERPGSGDQARGWGPPFIGEVSAYFLGTNRNKRGMTLNLAHQEGREILHQLVKSADVLIHNVPREKTRRKLGLDAETCCRLNPRLIWASISGFGNTGPYAEKAGYDVIAQGMSGTMAVTGEPDHGPIRFPTPIADLTAGIYTAFAIVAALFAREKTGKGQCIDSALLDAQVSWLANIASNYLATGEPIRKLGNAHPSIVPYQPFPTADDWIMVGAGSESLWERLLDTLGLPELKDDPRFRDNAARLKHRDELIPILEKAFRKAPAREWIQKLEEKGIPVGPINPPEKALEDPHVLEREMIVEIEHPLLGRLRSLGNPMKLSDTPVTYRLPPPLLGEHTEAILKELGFDAKTISRLKADGVV
ncbi:MAG: CoA transferase [Calditrichaeota bacterium]|nr:MAG: CoA transferase [Calditrichota bacterium]